MDTVEPTQTEPQVQEGPKQEKTALVVSVVISTVVLLIIGIIIVYILSNSNINLSNNSSSQDQIPGPVSYINNKSNEPLTFQYQGEHINAVLPLEWSLVEYTDVTGMKYAVNDPSITYTGLTGFEILNENNTAIFSFKGVDGIGGSGGCTELAQFADTQASYITNIQNETLEVGMDATVVTDYSSEDYTEISFAGKEFRRIGNNLFVNISTNPNYFNAGCGISRNIVSTTQFQFSINNSNNPNQSAPYDFRINPAISDETTLNTLDAVLNSIVAVN